MDKIDTKIIQLLKENSRTTCSDISKKVLLSVPAVTERLRKLEDESIIKQYSLRLNRKKIGLNVLAFVLVSIENHEQKNHLRELIGESDWIYEAHHITGEYDYLLKIAAENTDKLEIYITEVLQKITGVKQTNTIVVLSTIKEDM
jgi:Lrp/AsnC family leucine-responsive transcriptional regulator